NQSFIGKSVEENISTYNVAFIQKYYPDKADIIWRQLLQYKTRTGVFNLKLAWSTIYEVDLIAWWEGNFKESSSELCKVATQVLNIPSSLAAAERNWSDFSYIHNKK
ncbi:4078_t:CDS:2, partial [Gigaspora margarita]